MALMTHRSTSSTTVNTTYSSASFIAGEMVPPTCNRLDAAQRSRLIKSSRKLGKVLGTTPFVLESLPPLPALRSSTSMTETALKRCSAPPTPTSTYVDFGAAAAGSGATRSRKVSHASTLSDDESESSASHPFLAEPTSPSVIYHRKASSDGLAPLPVFTGSNTGRHKLKRLQQHQPVMRLPPASLGNAGLSSPHGDSFPSAFPSDYKVDSEKHPDPITTPLPRSPTSPVSPISSEMPPTPPPASLDHLENTSGAFPDDVYAYPGTSSMSNVEENDSRLRKRRMEKLMRHLGERVPSELVFGSTRPRHATSISNTPMSPAPQENVNTGTGRTQDTQSRVMRRVSVISGHRKRERDRTCTEETDTSGLGCLSDPESGNGARIHAVLTRERSEIRVGRGRRREKEKDRMQHLVEDDWTPEAYEDVVKRLRRLK